MIENEHTVCDTCDKDTGSFVGSKANLGECICNDY